MKRMRIQQGIVSFIHSGYFYCASAVHYYSEAIPTQHGHCRSFTSVARRRETPTTASEGLAQGPYVAARSGFEPTTLRTKGIDSTK